jgi:hypothetical protein
MNQIFILDLPNELQFIILSFITNEEIIYFELCTINKEFYKIIKNYYLICDKQNYQLDRYILFDHVNPDLLKKNWNNFMRFFLDNLPLLPQLPNRVVFDILEYYRTKNDEEFQRYIIMNGFQDKQRVTMLNYYSDNYVSWMHYFHCVKPLEFGFFFNRPITLEQFPPVNSNIRFG